MQYSVQLHGALEVPAELGTPVREHHFREPEVAHPLLLKGKRHLA